MLVAHIINLTQLVCKRFIFKYGYIDSTGIFAIPPKFDKAEPFSQGVAEVWLPYRECPDLMRVSGEKHYINKKGDYIWKRPKKTPSLRLPTPLPIPTAE